MSFFYQRSDVYFFCYDYVLIKMTDFFYNAQVHIIFK